MSRLAVLQHFAEGEICQVNASVYSMQYECSGAVTWRCKYTPGNTGLQIQAVMWSEKYEKARNLRGFNLEMRTKCITHNGVVAIIKISFHLIVPGWTSNCVKRAVWVICMCKHTHTLYRTSTKSSEIILLICNKLSYYRFW